MNIPADHIETCEEHWNVIKSIGDPPPLIPDLFLANRTNACSKVKEVLYGNLVRLKVDSHASRQISTFVSAYIAMLDDDTRMEITGRCLIISNSIAWN